LAAAAQRVASQTGEVRVCAKCTSTREVPVQRKALISVRVLEIWSGSIRCCARFSQRRAS
jgi:hypothetical protein